MPRGIKIKKSTPHTYVTLAGATRVVDLNKREQVKPGRQESNRMSRSRSTRAIIGSWTAFVNLRSWLSSTQILESKFPRLKASPFCRVAHQREAKMGGSCNDQLCIRLALYFSSSRKWNESQTKYDRVRQLLPLALLFLCSVFCSMAALPVNRLSFIL